jgi:hypothetical protein
MYLPVFTLPSVSGATVCFLKHMTSFAFFCSSVNLNKSFNKTAHVQAIRSFSTVLGKSLYLSQNYYNKIVQKILKLSLLQISLK